jgi:hypothetical protein
MQNFNSMTDLAILVNYIITNGIYWDKTNFDENQILKNFNSLGTWDSNFLKDRLKNFHQSTMLTDKQIANLTRILNNLLNDQSCFQSILNKNEWENPVYESKPIELKARFENNSIIFQCKPYQAKTIAEQVLVYQLQDNLFMMPLNSRNVELVDKIFMNSFEFEVSQELIDYVENIPNPNEIRFYIKNDNLFGYETDLRLNHGWFENANIYLRTNFLRNEIKKYDIVTNINDFSDYFIDPFEKAKNRFDKMKYIIINYDDSHSRKLVDFIENLNENEYICYDDEIYNALKPNLINMIEWNKKSDRWNFADYHKRSFITKGYYDNSFRMLHGIIGKLTTSTIVLRPFNNFTETQRFAQCSI